jgi:hypothetical protein
MKGIHFIRIFTVQENKKLSNRNKTFFKKSMINKIIEGLVNILTLSGCISKQFTSNTNGLLQSAFCRFGGC